MADTQGLIYSVVPDIFAPTRRVFLVWTSNVTRKGVAVERMVREAQPKRFLGVRMTKDGAISLANDPPPETPKPRIKHGPRHEFR